MSIRVDKMAEEIAKTLQKVNYLSTSGMKKAVHKQSNLTRDELKETSPKRSGAYAKSWTASKVLETADTLNKKVNNKKHYRLTHLLERGHLTRNKRSRTREFPHIAPAEEKAKANLPELMEKYIKKEIQNGI